MGYGHLRDMVKIISADEETEYRNGTCIVTEANKFFAECNNNGNQIKDVQYFADAKGIVRSIVIRYSVVI